MAKLSRYLWDSLRGLSDNYGSGSSYNPPPFRLCCLLCGDIHSTVRVLHLENHQIFILMSHSPLKINHEALEVLGPSWPHVMASLYADSCNVRCRWFTLMVQVRTSARRYVSGLPGSGGSRRIGSLCGDCGGVPVAVNHLLLFLISRWRNLCFNIDVNFPLMGFSYNLGKFCFLLMDCLFSVVSC